MLTFPAPCPRGINIEVERAHTSDNGASVKVWVNDDMLVVADPVILKMVKGLAASSI